MLFKEPPTEGATTFKLRGKMPPKLYGYPEQFNSTRWIFFLKNNNTQLICFSACTINWIGGEHICYKMAWNFTAVFAGIIMCVKKGFSDSGASDWQS